MTRVPVDDAPVDDAPVDGAQGDPATTTAPNAGHPRTDGTAERDAAAATRGSDVDALAGCEPARPPRRTARRAVRPGTGQPDPLVALRSVDDTDLGWQPAEDSNDERLRRDVPPHW